LEEQVFRLGGSVIEMERNNILELRDISKLFRVEALKGLVSSRQRNYNRINRSKWAGNQRHLI
jgi:hypothetical protein